MTIVMFAVHVYNLIHSCSSSFPPSLSSLSSIKLSAPSKTTKTSNDTFTIAAVGAEEKGEGVRTPQLNTTKTIAGASDVVSTPRTHTKKRRSFIPTPRGNVSS